MPIIRSVPVRWASVLKPNTQFEPVYEVEVVLTKDQATELMRQSKEIDVKGKGLKIKKNEDDGTLSIRFRRKQFRPDGTENVPPVAVDRDGKTSFTKLIGNGSICNVQYGIVQYKHPKFGEGVTTDFKGIQVLEHVQFGEQDGEGFGNEAEESSSTKESFDDEDF